MTPKILKFLRLLGSENEHEVLSAIRFLKKELERNKMSWNQFVDSMIIEKQKVTYMNPEAPPRPQYNYQDFWKNVQQTQQDFEENQRMRDQAFQEILNRMARGSKGNF